MLIVLGVLGVTVATLFLFRGRLETLAFNSDGFAECFRDELVAEYQSNAALSGNSLLATSADSMLGPSLESLAHEIAKSVERNGVSQELEAARQESARQTSAWLLHYEETGRPPDDQTAGMVADATVECLEKQKLF
jgi:hypothetical protein